jgi:hypothetical protein
MTTLFTIVAAQAVLARYNRPCLLCAKDRPDQCHRRLIAERLQAVIPGLEVIHLL